MAGIPDGSFVNAIREDPVRRGLLYAATETGVYVSFDDGVAWQSLRLNMPMVSVRDIAVHAGDLAIATHGRAFWILDDIEPLREFAAGVDPSHARLLTPRVAFRTRDGNDEAEASPPETPLGENPPNGAFLDYIVPPGAHGPLRLELQDTRGTIRSYASDDVLKATDPKDVPYPAYWIAQPQPLSLAPGLHRFVWDYHIGDSDGPLAVPGTYRVRLSLDGHTYSQQLTLRRDPRLAATDADLLAQTVLARSIDALRTRVREALAAAVRLRAANPAAAARIDALAGVVPAPAPDDSTGSAQSNDTTSLRYDARLLADLETSVESADERPTVNESEAWSALRDRTTRALNSWQLLASGLH
jgi:hypothetical protein